MDYVLDDDIFTNNIQYFFSLHGPRFDYMNVAMANSLSKKYGKEFRPIRIINAWPSKAYNSPNYIILNKRGYKLANELKKPVVFLPDYEDVNIEFTQNSFISQIAEELLKKQEMIFVYPFTTAFLELKPSFKVLGPNNELAKSLDSKVNQLKLFKKLNLPHNKATIFENEKELLKHEDQIIPSYISATYTSGGNESGLIYSKEMLYEFLAKLRQINKKGSFVVSEIFENINLAPNVNTLVTSDGKVFILVLSDQILEGNRYLGNSYPSLVSETNKKEIYKITEKIGSYLASQGYTGLFGCDFLINKDGELVIVDLNPRHQGGYVCNGLALQQIGINLTDIELQTLLGEDFELSQQQLDKKIKFSWSHSKIIPNEKGQIIQNEINQNSITEPFNSIGRSFVSEFYKKGSIFVEGYIGYQVHTAKESEQLKDSMLHTREVFDKHVLSQNS